MWAPSPLRGSVERVQDQRSELGQERPGVRVAASAGRRSAARRTTPRAPRRARAPCSRARGRQMPSTTPTSRVREAARASATAGLRGASRDSSSLATSELALVQPALEQRQGAAPTARASSRRSQLGPARRRARSTSAASAAATYWVTATWSACRVRRYAEQVPSGSPARRSTARWVSPRSPSSATTCTAASSSSRRRGVSSGGLAVTVTEGTSTESTQGVALGTLRCVLSTHVEILQT